MKKHPKGALLKLPFFTTDMKKKFFANLWLTFHSWSPYPCGIADIDFCIIFSNALDNAISACNRVPHDNQKYIHITGKVQGDFLLIEIINSHSGRGSIRSGTGLANIKAVAEKYHGAMEVRIDGDIFVLSVLLIIPQQSESISQQIC